MRFRDGLGRRSASALLALGIEALVLLALLTLGRSISEPLKSAPSLVSIAIHESDDVKKPAEAQKPDQTKDHPHAVETARPPAQSSPQVAPLPAAAPTTAPAAIIPVNPQQMAAFDISRLPRAGGANAAKGRLMGPADGEAEPDSQRVGTAPGGQPLYAASWYRKPYDEELAGYLSTAQGPGWGLIACKTAPEYRVVDCVPLDEYPQGSNIARAVLAAAWQFKVRPPRIGGVSQVGDWVRIRIDYGFKAKS
ncbi:MAG: hypothetical protein KGL48_03570 [Sphingomonadales bacterium]|nr:hypothetical protein [Sphingomonadales bacterium]MDE2567979.1 hypothetical protein [Sphingomonadales bacterium]